MMGGHEGYRNKLFEVWIIEILLYCHAATAGPLNP